MPVYEYVCHECGARFEMYRYLSQDDEDVVCPVCNAVGVEKCFSSFSSPGEDCSSSTGFS